MKENFNYFYDGSVGE